jgi:diguanylate cyclase (GGDEF)-like protein
LVITGLRTFLRVLFGANAADYRVKQRLFNGLYAHPFSLAIGTASCAFIAIVAASHSNVPLIWSCAELLCLVGVARVAMALFARKLQETASPRLVRTLWVTALTYSGLLGLMTSLTLFYPVPPGVTLLVMCNAIAYAAGAAASNASRPAIAITQLHLTLAPPIVMLVARGDVESLALALSTGLLIPGMAIITMTIFKALHLSVKSAEANAHQAEDMQRLARTDVVTGLLNRAGLNHHVGEQLATLYPNEQLAMFWLDLDRFKEVNDTLGHQIGDKVLSEVGRRLAALAPQGASVARFGGDEFIVASIVHDRADAEALARQILDDFNRPLDMGTDQLHIDTSIGIALLPTDAEDLDSAMQAADLALYHSKVNGRSQFSFFEPAMTRKIVRRREIEAELRHAVQRDELSIFFQPFVDLASGRIRGFEALVRWFHPKKGELPPADFIPVAEETGAIVTLGNWIISQAARAAAGWPEDVTLSVNLSPLQIKAPGAALGILNALREARLSPERLELEITEAVLLDHSCHTESFMADLGAAGVRFVLDDFGKGHSSLNYLNQYRFSRVKVDRSFVSGESAGPGSDAIIRAVAEVAGQARIELVAEGLETIEQVQSVRQAGCTLGQGYYFSRAVPDYIAAMLLAQERESPPSLRVVG